MAATNEDILLEVASLTDYPAVLRGWADLLVQLGLNHRYGVYAERLPVAGMGIYLGRHDRESAAGTTKRPPR